MDLADIQRIGSGSGACSTSVSTQINTRS